MMLRSFIAIEVPPPVQEAIIRETEPLRRMIGPQRVRWVAPENIHLTIQFLGDVSPANLERLAEALRSEVAIHPAFSLSGESVGAFPNTKRARVLWVSVRPSPALQALAHSIQTVNKRMGYPPEEGKFSPHLTIGRVRQQVNATDLDVIRQALESHPICAFGSFTVNSVSIFKSDLKPSGPVYTRLYSLPLGQIPS